MADAKISPNFPQLEMSWGNGIFTSAMSVTDQLIPEDGEEAEQERAALSSEQCFETVHKAPEGKSCSG